MAAIEQGRAERPSFEPWVARLLGAASALGAVLILRFALLGFSLYGSSENYDSVAGWSLSRALAAAAPFVALG